MGASVGGNNRFVSEINVTPFVDVMLVLLIIFMVATPMMSQGLEVDLPQTKQVEVLPTENDNMMLTVRHDGKIFLDEYEVQTMDDLEGYLQTLVKEKNKTLFLRADKEVPYGVVVDVMGRIKAVGIEKLGVVADSSESLSPAAAAAAATTAPFLGAASAFAAEKTLRVGVTAGPSAQILEYVVPIAKELGLNVKIYEFQDYIQPNAALDAGECVVAFR